METKYQQTSNVARGGNSGYLTPAKVCPVTPYVTFLRCFSSTVSVFFLDDSILRFDDVGPLEPETTMFTRALKRSKQVERL